MNSGKWLEQLSNSDVSHPLKPYVVFMGHAMMNVAENHTLPQFKRTNLDRLAKQAQLKANPVDETRMELYFSYLIDSGFLKHPSKLKEDSLR